MPITATSLDEENAGQKKLLVQEVRGALDLFFRSEKWNKEDVLRVLYLCWYEDAEIEAMYENIMDNLETAEEGDDPLNDPAFREEFKKSTLEQFRKIMFSDLVDPLTRLGAMYPLERLPTVSDYFDERSAKFFLKNFFVWGFGSVTGRPNAGKTNFACVLMELAGQLNMNVATNIKMIDPPQHVFYTTSFSKLLLHCAKNQKEGRKTLIILDEMPQFFTKKRATSGQYLTFEKVLFLLRKVGGNLIGIVQRPSDIPTVVKEFSESYYQKLDHKTLLFQRDRPGGGKEQFVIGGIPATKLNYDTNDIASFTVDLDLQALQDYIAHLEGHGNQLDAIIDYIENIARVESPDGKILKERTAIQYLREEVGYKQSEIADILHIDQPRVSRRLRESK